MSESILVSSQGRIGVITLNKPEILNAWDRPMRDALVEALERFAAEPGIGAIILTGAGDRAFGAGQDLNEAKTFDAERAGEWIDEWRRLYGTIRGLEKPLVCALNGLAAGSAFQVALLADLRVGHPEVLMGQPEINSGLPSVTGPWVMQYVIGHARAIDLTLTGRMVEAEEAYAIGMINRLVPRAEVMATALVVADELAGKAPLAMRLNKARFREVTEAAFEETMRAAARIHAEAYGAGEPAEHMEKFLGRSGAAEAAH